jgi:4-hydroxy-tetrahydrodipicolinate synthase
VVWKKYFSCLVYCKRDKKKKQKKFSEMVNQCMDGDFATARPMHEKFLPIINSLFVEGSPSGVKAYLNEMGIVKNTFRLPVVGVGEALKEKIKKLMETV